MRQPSLVRSCEPVEASPLTVNALECCPLVELVSSHPQDSECSDKKRWLFTSRENVSLRQSLSSAVLVNRHQQTIYLSNPSAHLLNLPQSGKKLSPRSSRCAATEGH